ncbi:MAG TPA: phosphoenolpyruvate carboxykinase (ATP) [Planctomycetota bacterium]|nr:phosphoenolpyruvate carboxykinase (ATP) [Planctomycetota bacterium]
MPAPGIYPSLPQLETIGITFPKSVYYNLPTPVLYEEAIQRGEGHIAFRGPIVINTGKHTGRAVADRFVVEEPGSSANVWWGKTNKPISETAFSTLVARMSAFFQHKDVFVQDCYAGADPEHHVPLRVITGTALHALFARTMFIRPDNENFDDHVPEITILHAPNFHAVPHLDFTRSDAFIIIHLSRKMILIGGTAYAGEIKKAVFSILNYLMPRKGIMSMHCSANIGSRGDTAVFFGLSGTGKTTLSADPSRKLIGDDEHGWSDKGVFNYEGGCYAKVIRLNAEEEPEIFARTQAFGTILENVVMDPLTRKLDLDSASITENTRAAYPLALISYSARPSVGGHAENIVLLTCDASGVLPPISRLTAQQTMYHFISGYSAKLAGTEIGLGKDPEATFSTCFGAPFMVLPPRVYAELLGKKIDQHKCKCWLVNTGWTGGPFGVGKRMKISHTRALLNAALDGKLDKVEYTTEPVFGLQIPNSCEGVPSAMLVPRETWPDKAAYDKKAQELAAQFKKNFEQYAASVSGEVAAAGPR